MVQQKKSYYRKGCMNTWWRDLIRKWHPEGIPWPMSLFYNAISQTDAFARHYDLVAHHVGSFCQIGKLLDIGTGPGWLLAAIQGSLPGLQLVGVDISPAMVDVAMENMRKAGYETAVCLKIAGADELPFPDNTFDVVVSTGSLHHWKDPIAALNEVYRVLKTNGYALIYDLVRKLPPSVAEAVKREYGPFRTRMLWLHSFEEPFYNPEDMEALIPDTSFQTVQLQFVGALCCLILRKTDHHNRRGLA
jgi:ubiquinone/menaquinone biosynthesis C-methylase UbiE